MPPCGHLRFITSAPSPFPVFFSNGNSLHLAAKLEIGPELASTIPALTPYQSQPGQETEAVLGVSVDKGVARAEEPKREVGVPEVQSGVRAEDAQGAESAFGGAFPCRCRDCPRARSQHPQQGSWNPVPHQGWHLIHSLSAVQRCFRPLPSHRPAVPLTGRTSQEHSY